MLALGILALAVSAPAQLAPFEPDEHTLLLYHFDEGEGGIARDASGRGYDGELRGPARTTGKFGGALWFDGKDDSVFREVPETIQGLRQLTVECWFSQEETSGRRFLVGQDVGFHFEVADRTWAGLSIYNQGGVVPNAEGKPHQQLGAGLGSLRTERWHHLAATYDGGYISFFLNGVLRGRHVAAKEFLLGAPSRGLWIGCYVDMDYYFSGKIDEVRVSDCIRYDPDRALAEGGRVFEVPTKGRPPKAVRTLQKTGLAQLDVTLRKLRGSNASGWVCLKPPGQPASIVGQYALSDLPDGTDTPLTFDVSDEVGPEGEYILGLEQQDAGAYIAVTAARLVAEEQAVAEWTGDARSRRTFSPPVLVPLQVGEKRDTIPIHGVPDWYGVPLLSPLNTDRVSGALEIDAEDPSQPPLLMGDGHAEWWLSVPRETTYRVHLRYAASSPRPCDIVIDGDDLNAFDMCAANVTGRSTAHDAFWEVQGTVTLAPGPHWIRVQDALPDIVALRLEPVSPPKPRTVPWEGFPQPDPGFLGQAREWEPQLEFGRPTEATLALQPGDEPTLRFSAGFESTDAHDLFAADRVRFVHRLQADLEPFGRLTFRFEGQGSGHVVALWLVDVKGDEKLLWRSRDREAGVQEVSVPISFEGNDVFDPAHVVAVCLDLDEGNWKPEQPNSFAGALIGPRFVRRDAVVQPEGYAARSAAAVEAASRLPRDEAQFLSPGFRPWTRPVVPEGHPLFASTDPKPVTRATLGYDLRFCGARSIDANSLRNFHDDYDFGDICWPHIGILPQRRDFGSDADYAAALRGLEERLIDVRDRGLVLWDIWGYVPNNEAGPTPRVTPEHHEVLTRVLGDRFLGYDNGEQDGRYIGSYADRDSIVDRRSGWDAFVKWDEGICNDGMNYMNATGSLNFSHYYGERGARTLGLETAQGLPSDTLMFAFLRGASKQYGRLTTQATSIWSRFGYNMYNDRRTDGPNGYGLGPHKGCSLSLHKRLFLCSYLGGDSIVGSETSQFTGDTLENGAPELSPLGKQHLAIREWAQQHPDRGVMYTPVAFMLDFYHGWNMPRHLYRGDKYKIWGKLPYEKGDYLIDNVFRMVWPGYEDCSYLRNERGFVCPTPFGDSFDVLTNRCHPDVLKQYTAVMLLGDVEMTPEAVANLSAFVEAGGDLLLDAKHAQAFPTALTGVTLGETTTGVLSWWAAVRNAYEEPPYTYTKLTLQGAEGLLYSEAGDALLALNQAGKGRVIVCAADYWMTDPLTYAKPDLVNMEPPYTLLRGIHDILWRYFGSFSPVAIEPDGLAVRVNCFPDDPNRLLVGLINNDLFADWSGRLTLREGELASAHDLWRGRDLPEGRAVRLTVPAGDVAVVDLRVRAD